jgi:hypothetical protein
MLFLSQKKKLSINDVTTLERKWYQIFFDARTKENGRDVTNYPKFHDILNEQPLNDIGHDTLSLINES